MKKLLFLFVGLFLVVSASAQNDQPTANWPYLYPDFMEGELLRANKDSNKGCFNIHLNLSALHYVDKKEFSKFLKANDIRWNDVQDLVKVLDYVTAR